MHPSTDILTAALAVVSAARAEVATSEGHLACVGYPCALCASLAAFDAVPQERALEATADAVYADDDVCPSTGGAHVVGPSGFCTRCEEAA